MNYTGDFTNEDKPETSSVKYLRGASDEPSIIG